MVPLIYEENKSYEEEACHICERKFVRMHLVEIIKIEKKVKDHCHYSRKYSNNSL